MRPITEYHPLLGYSFAANVAESVPHERGHYVVRTNSGGFRCDRERSIKREAHRYRILLFGDSFTAADGVDNCERYSDLLEKSMTDAEILNFGLPGSGTDQQLLMFQEKGLRYEFDLVLVAPLLENIRRNVADFRLAVDRLTGEQVLVPKPSFKLVEGKLKLCNVPVSETRLFVRQATPEMLKRTDFGGANGSYVVRDMINRYLPFLKPALLTTRSLFSQTHSEYLNRSSSSWTLMRSLLEEFKRLAGGKTVVICPLPY